jgi:hypothetical protein
MACATEITPQSDIDPPVSDKRPNGPFTVHACSPSDASVSPARHFACASDETEQSELAPPERSLLSPQESSEPQIAVSAPRVPLTSRGRGIGADQGLGRRCPPPGPNPQESPGNQRHVRGAPSSEWPANRPVFALIRSILKIEVSAVQVRLSPLKSPANNPNTWVLAERPVTRSEFAAINRLLEPSEETLQVHLDWVKASTHGPFALAYLTGRGQTSAIVLRRIGRHWRSLGVIFDEGLRCGLVPPAVVADLHLESFNEGPHPCGP